MVSAGALLTSLHFPQKYWSLLECPKTLKFWLLASNQCQGAAASFWRKWGLNTEALLSQDPSLCPYLRSTDHRSPSLRQGHSYDYKSRQSGLACPGKHQGSWETLSVVKLRKEKAVGDNTLFFILSMPHRNSSALSLR